MLTSYTASRESQEPANAGNERFHSILATSTSILSSEKNREKFESTLDQADVLMITLDLDGVLFNRYDQLGRPIDESTDKWTDPMIADELKMLGESLKYLKRACDTKGKKLLVALNTNRETDMAMRVFSELPDEIAQNCLSSLEAGHVITNLDKKGNLVTQSLADLDPEIAPLKSAIKDGLEKTFRQGLLGKLAYKPFRQGMITYRNVDQEFVGWDDDAKTVSGPLLSILQEYGYPANQNFGVAYYPFDGGLDIFFPKFTKKSGQETIIDTAGELDLIKQGEKVLQVHFGDTWSDALNDSGKTNNGICYDVFTFAVANSQQRLLDHALATSQSTHRWGVYEGIRLLEDMLTKPKLEKKLGHNGSIIKLIQSYLGPETPTDKDFNLKEVLETIDLNKAQKLIEQVKITQTNKGRVFIIGNGGSYDNARLISLLLRSNGINADVPGSGQKYLEAGLSNGHDYIFESTLNDQKLNEKDLVIAISGSGNSPNIIRAIEYAQKQNSLVFTLGGRDGGKMCPLAGPDNSFVVKSQTMEIIEDVHAVFGYMVATSVNASPEEVNKTLIQQRQKSIEIMEQLLKKENTQAMANILLAIEKTLLTKGRIIFIGDSIGVNHIRADMARGATNQLPFSFRVVENLGSTNSSMATQNDDGVNLVLVHSLENIRPTKEDVVVILNSPGRTQDKNLQLCYELAKDSKAHAFLIGDSLPSQQSDVSSLGVQTDYELMTTILADLFGRTLHEHLVESMGIEVKEFNLKALPSEIYQWFNDRLGNDRKLGSRETLEFEHKLSQISLLPDDKVVTFCYGKVYTVDSPSRFGLERSFY